MEIPLVNMRESSSDSFEAPTVEQVGQIRIGDFVKVCCQGEQFWAMVTEIRAPELQEYVFDTIFVATVSRHIVGMTLCKYGDSILVHGYEIYAITH
jgi:hypothetical protein